MRFSNALPAIASMRCLKTDPDRQRRPVPRRRSREQMRGATPGAGGRAPQLVDGRQDLGRFRDDDEQGARADRGASSVRPAVGPDRHPRPSAVGDPFAGRVYRRLGARPARQRPTCAFRSLMRWPGPSGWRRRPSGSTSREIGTLDFEAPDLDRFPGAARWRARRSRRAAPRRSSSMPPTKSRSPPSSTGASASPTLSQLVETRRSNETRAAPRSPSPTSSTSTARRDEHWRMI